MRGTVALGHVDPNFDLQLHISSYKENHKTEVLTRAQTHNKRKITLTKILASQGPSPVLWLH